MKNNRKFLLPLLFLTPLLLGNSPAPIVYPDEYEDFSCSFYSKEPTTDIYGDNVYKYTFKVDNIGAGYIEHIYVSNAENTFWGTGEGDRSIFGYSLVCPDESGYLSFTSNKDYDAASAEFSYQCFAYQKFVTGVTFHPTSVRHEVINGQHYYYAIFETNVDIEGDRKHEYGAIATITYQDVKYVSHFDVNKNSEFFICASDEELELSKLNVDQLLMTKDVAHGYGGYFAFILYLALFGGLIVLGSGVIFVIIFFSIKAARRRKAANS